MTTTFALIRRQVTPALWTTLVAWLRFGCLVSPRAEVELSRNLVIGKGTRISAFAKIKSVDGPLRIGSRVVVGSCVAIASGRAGVEIGDDCFLSPNVVLAPGTHRYARLDTPILTQGMDSRGIRIGDDVWIGANCTVLDGARIGHGSIVTPNSVVSGKLGPLSIAQGNPAKVIFTRR